MRKIIAVILVGMLVFAGCENLFRDELAQIHKELDGMSDRLDAFCNETNANISALQIMISALQNKDYVTSVVPVVENGNEIGYQINFEKSGKVTIYHGSKGKDGSDGNDGKDGKDGGVPNVGLKQDTDGAWYWTLDGNWLLDSKGQKVKASAKDGEDGVNGEKGENGANGVTPKLKIENEYWYVSYDNGATWEDEPLGKATGSRGDSLFSDIDCSNDGYVVITLSDGEKIMLSTWNVKDDMDGIMSMIQSVTYIPRYTDGKAMVLKSSADGWVVELDFRVTPKAAVARLGANWQSILALKAVYTQTRAVTIIDLPILTCEVDESNGVITIAASGENLSDDFYKGTQAASASLELSDGKSEIVSEYIPLVAGRRYSQILYTTTDGKAVTPYRPEAFDAEIISNTYENGVGVITFSDNLTKVDYYAFRGCDNLLTMTFPSTVTEFGQYVFYSCDNLTEIYCKSIVPPAIYYQYKDIGAFPFYTVTIYVPSESYNEYTKWPASSWLELGIDPMNWSQYKSQLVPYDFDKTVVTTPIPTSKQIFYTSSDGSVVEPASKTVFGASIVSNTNVGGIGVITFDGDVTSLGFKAFYGRTKLTSITYPSTVTSIGEEAFSGCTALCGDLTISDNITEIGVKAFQGCVALDGVLTIGKSVTSIGDAAFAVYREYQETLYSYVYMTSTLNFTEVRCRATTPPKIRKPEYWHADLSYYSYYYGSFGYYGAAPSTFVVPIGTLDEYKNSNWGAYTKSIFIEEYFE